MKTLQIINLMICTIVLYGTLVGCKEEIANQPIAKGDKPNKVTDVKIESLPGGAEISYILPAGGVAYVLAEYEIRAGVKHQAKSSRYKNSVTIEGFATEGEYDVTLYAVGEGEERSEPVMIKAVVLPSSLQTAYASMVIKENFGGLNLLTSNPSGADLTVDILTLDDENNLKIVYTHYTSQKDIAFSVKGYDSTPTPFWFTMRDRWGNLTDTLSKTLTPLYEERLDRTLMVEYDLPGDLPKGHNFTFNGALTGIRSMSYLFDGKTAHPHFDIYHTISTGSSMPHSFTFDMGKAAILSSMRLWPRNDNAHKFAGTAVKNFRLWGSLGPNPDGSFDDSWHLIGQFEVIKPSGLPLNTLGPEDNAAVTDGIDFDLVPTSESELLRPFRYIRFQTLNTFGGTPHITLAELAFWGVYQ